MLSNWHVFHGDEAALNDNIVQPGPHDDNQIEQNEVGRLVRSHLGRAGDCAISSIGNRNFTEEIMELGVKVRTLVEPELDDRVIKSGRTTGVTYGIVERVHVVVDIKYGEITGRKEIGGFEIGVDVENRPANGEVSMGGDSGAAWMIVGQNGNATDMMAGLHFAGETRDNLHEHALACYPKSVFEKLNIKPSIPRTIARNVTNGYNKNFLDTTIKVPVLNDDRVAVVEDGSIKINYTHFSLALSKTRKFAIWVAWNIDGGKIKRLSRKGINFKLDRRINANYQIGNDLYKNNNLDRGHLARRADLVWGNLDEAKKANRDSFYYTNITPQMNDFNQSSKQGVWGRLENAVFNDVEVDNLKVSVIGGPVFREGDSVYREEQIPKEYFKVIIYEEDGDLKSKGFLLTQNLNNLEVLDLDEFRVYEVSLTEIEQLCHFKFDESLHAAAIDAALEELEERLPLEQIADINW